MSPRRTDADTISARLARAGELQAQAARENASGHPRRGRLLVERGLRLLAVPEWHDAGGCDPDRCRLTARLLATLAKSTVEMDGVAAALVVMDRSLGWSQCVADDGLTGPLLGQRGLILFRGGRLDDARAAFDDALARMPVDDADAMPVLLNRGALQVEQGLLGPARTDLERAARIARQLGHRQFEHGAVHNLGCLEFIAGDLPLALRLMQASLELDQETLEGLTHLDRARVLLAAGLPDEADAALVEAAELFRRDRCWQDLAETDLTRAEVALLTGRLPDARRLAGRARDRFRRHGNDRWRRAAELVLLRADRAAGRPPSRLLPPAQRLAGELAQAGPAALTRGAELLVAELLLADDRTADAERLLGRIGRVRRSDPIAIRLHSRLVRAESEERHGQVTAARRTIARGLSDLATYRAQFGGLDLQSASAVHGRRLAVRDLELALASGRPAAVQSAVERSRAVTSRITPVTPPADPQTAALLAELRRVAEASHPDQQRVAALQAELRSRSWLASGSRAWHPPTTGAELRTAAVDDDCHLVVLTELHGRLRCVTVSPGRPAALAELGDGDTVRGWQRRLLADLDVLANAALPAALRATVTRSLRRSAAELGQLLAPAIPADDRAVVLSPAGDLLAVPWGLLPPLQDRPVAVTPSLSGWHRARARQSATRAAASTAWSMTAVAGPGLDRVREETAAVAASWRDRAEALDIPQGSAAELLAALATSRLVHVAAHGVHQGGNPMFSSLSLAGGPLYAYEVDRQGRVPEHVVLSACDVGRSTVREGEETLGLTSVLLQLGTVSVTAGVAQVHDDVAAEVMQGYHGELARGRGSAEALLLAAARLDVPSPFVCFGASWSTDAGS